jgi:hypothetical protein
MHRGYALPNCHFSPKMLRLGLKVLSLNAYSPTMFPSCCRKVPNDALNEFPKFLCVPNRHHTLLHNLCPKLVTCSSSLLPLLTKGFVCLFFFFFPIF